MKILVTGAAGFVGKNLVETLKCASDGRDKFHSLGEALTIYEYDRDSTPEELDLYCSDCDFVFNLAGVNRPKDNSEFMEGNFGFASTLLDTLKKHNNTCPVMLSSSIQATLLGRYAGSDYGASKLAGEELFFKYSYETGAKVLVYRFPNLFGKWCRPNYNSAVATFCNNKANGLEITVNDPSTELTLVYIDDLVNEMFAALRGEEHRCDYDEEGNVVPDTAGKYAYVPVTHTVTLGEIVELLDSFVEQPNTLMMPDIPKGSFAKKLYSTYLSYLPKDKAIFDLKMNCDQRGSFTELLKTAEHGQFSVNVSKPGITKGQHWHHTKWEFFIVVSGHGKIQQRRVGVDENGNPFPVIEYEVSGEKIQAIHMLPGYAHNIINLSDTQDLVTLMWANELLEQDRPDTYREEV
ncbi:UDP-2-acetamido-2,6-beta-L-arabino-hexul-4-ose reductase [Pseudobutyrivibrio sp. UC1225]|uniref:polysaccharide biosynthesis C-terminal domain-containing protein n=1 Tax=Pseudobutyrivibrio sp. UC1225 TaxID=1798185 RepID=UPI0008E65755|nr:NAD-dependent epimerase/dehydratase family protein [Pseudobutyrivibrio sp. UC1225]SFO21204.1 UDP-2-acetamido-2,6-beta-L-arabino-hexul-4-ose reductase [Pseudobutyrivibrio sp. UC1225]